MQQKLFGKSLRRWLLFLNKSFLFLINSIHIIICSNPNSRNMRCGVREEYSRVCHNGVTRFMNVLNFRYFFLFTYMYILWWIDYTLPVIRFYCSIRYRNHPVSSPIRHIYGSWTHPKSFPDQHLYPVAEPPPHPRSSPTPLLTLHGSCSQDPPTYSPTRHLSPTGFFCMLTPAFKPPHPFFSLGDIVLFR